MANKKLAFVFKQALDPSAGGVQRTTWQLGHWFGKNGWDVAYLSFSAAGHREPELGRLVFPGKTIECDRFGRDSAEVKNFLEESISQIRPGIVINQTGVPVEPARSLDQIGRQVEYQVITAFRNNPAQIRENQADILRHLFRKNKHLLALIDRPVGWRLLLMLHRIRNRSRFQEALARCDRFVLLSPTFLSELEWYVSPLPATKVATIPNAFAIPEGSFDIDKKSNHLLFVGRIEQAQKNVFALVDIWERISDALPDWELHIVGDGPDKQDLERKFKDRGLNRVKFHGKQKPFPFYAKAKIFCMVSRFEGFGNTLIEAQMHGVVPIAFDSYSALTWILNDDKDALVVPAFDVDAYAAEVVNLASDTGWLERLSKAAKQNAQRFSEDTVGAQWLELFDEITFDDDNPERSTL